MKILKFSTPTCTYCKITSPQVNEYAEKHGFEVIEVDASEDTETAGKYEVMSVPVVVLIADTGDVTKLTGFGEIMSHIKE